MNVRNIVLIGSALAIFVGTVLKANEQCIWVVLPAEVHIPNKEELVEMIEKGQYPFDKDDSKEKEQEHEPQNDRS